MSQDPNDIRRRLDDLATRLEALEEWVGIRHAAETVEGMAERPSESASGPIPPTRYTAAPPVVPPPVMPWATPARPPASTRLIPPLPPPVAPPRPALSDPALERFRATSARIAAARAGGSSQGAGAVSIERLVGGWVFAAIGALIVIVGVGLFVKLGIDRGWFGWIGPIGKCSMGGAFGLVLLSVGEIIRRKINPTASVGITAAGLGALYASAYAIYGVYAKVDAGVAFALLVAISMIGIVVATRARLASIAVLSLLGAYLTPIVLRVPDPEPLVMPVYLTALLGLGLSLSARLGGPFTILRGVVWWGTVLLGSGWVVAHGYKHPFIALPFLAAAWAAMHAELIVSARRVSATSASPPPHEDARPDYITWRVTRPVLTSFSSTAWTVVLGVLALHWAAPPIVPDWFVPASGLVVAIGLSMLLAGNLRVLTDVPRTDTERLGAALMMQAGALLITTVALALSDWYQAAAWMAMGLAALGAARWLRARSLDIYGLAVLAIAAGRLILWDSWRGGLTSGGHPALGLYFTQWTLLMTFCAAAWFAAARIIYIDAGRIWRGVSRFTIGVGLTLLCGSVVHASADQGAMSICWALIAMGGVLIGWRLSAPALHAYGFIILIIATAKLALYDSWASSVGAGRGGIDVMGLYLTVWTGLMVVCAAAWLGAALVVLYGIGRTRSEWRTMAVIATGAGLAVLFGSLIHERSSQASISVAWLWLGLLTTLAHTAERRLALDWYGLIGTLASIAPWVGAFVEPGWAQSLAPVGVHPGLLLGLSIVAGLAGTAWWLRRQAPDGDPTARSLAMTALVSAIILAFAATSLEVARGARVLSHDETSQMAAVSIWWGLFAVGMLVAGFAWRIPPCRHAGLALLGAATLKAVIMDLAEVPAVWRVASFIGLGLLMLGVAAAYAKVSARLRQLAGDQPPGADAPNPPLPP